MNFNKTKVYFFAALVMVSQVTWGAKSPEQRGLEIAQKSEKANDGFKGERSTMEMILINAHGDRTPRKMKSMVIETKKDGDKSITTFNWPADVKGTKMLTWTHKEGSDDQWLFLPSLRRVKKIRSNNKSGSFMGSEFSYEDLGSQETEKYTYKYLREETVGGRKQWVIERYPTDKRSGYTKQVVWMDQEYLNAIKIDYYDRKKELLKTANFEGYKKYQKKFWRASAIKVLNHQTKKSSELTWKDRKLGVQFTSDQFSSENLKD